MENSLNLLSRKAGFNTALRHFRKVTEYVKAIGGGANLADLLTDDLAEGKVQRYQVKSIVSALLVDKFEYEYISHNLDKTIEESEAIVQTLAKWNKLNIVIAYNQPQAGLLVINPKNPAHWDASIPLIRDELAIVYVGATSGEADKSLLKQAAQDVIAVVYGKDVVDRDEYVGSKAESALAAQKAAAPKPSRSSATRRMTPRYSVLVTNELFHNGNVEAWKKIIESYQDKYPGLDVLIWYEQERINDINALFKWGKVKHGTPILVSVVGENIQDVRKLQRYLFEGASPRFEAFLKGGVDRTLDLF